MNNTKWPKYSDAIKKWLNEINDNYWPAYQLEVRECLVSPLNPDEFWGSSIDYPQLGINNLDKQSIHIGGWVFSKNSPVMKINVRQDGSQNSILTTTNLNTQRPDVANVFAGKAQAINTGFNCHLSVKDLLKNSSVKTSQLMRIHSIEGLMPDSCQELWNFYFDQFSVPILPSIKNELHLAGWLLTKKSPAEKIDVIFQNQVIQTILVNCHRPDVQGIYPQVSWSQDSGFTSVINLPINNLSDRLSEIVLQTTLKNGDVLPLAKIKYSFMRILQDDKELEFSLDACLQNGVIVCLAKIKCHIFLSKDILNHQNLTRQQKVLYHIDKNTYGIEIGPSHNPIAPKKEGYKVHIIDHLNRQELITKYTGHNLQLENIEEVDYVWQGEDYVTLTGKSKFYDWIIASHVIEHTPDLIGFLLNCDSILKDDGIISLVVPDKRFCFDHYRPITGLSKIIDAYYLKHKIHTPGTVAEYDLNVITKSGRIAWEPDFKGENQLMGSLAYARQRMEELIKQPEYIDVHAWCFTPHSFRLIIHDLYNLGLIPFQELSFFPTTNTCEFYITLSRQGKGSGMGRLEMLNQVDEEIIIYTRGDSKN